jgi:hypothetical protein
MSNSRRFILQAIHPEYACPAFVTMFETEQLAELQELLGPDAQDDPDFERVYWLEAGDLSAISRQFAVPFEAGDRDVVLFKYSGPSKVPYLVHTNYELALMVDGRKKFAQMYQEYPPHRHLYEDQFDRFVAQGLLHKEVDVEKFDKPLRAINGKTYEGLRTAYYTPKGEEWRIPAWRLVEHARDKGGWNETLERLEGILYGYEDWQIEWWIEFYRKRQRS